MIFERACKLGLEGIVCKRVDLPYRPGPSKSWIKVKNKAHPAMLRIKEAFELENCAASRAVSRRSRKVRGHAVVQDFKAVAFAHLANLRDSSSFKKKGASHI